MSIDNEDRYFLEALANQRQETRQELNRIAREQTAKASVGDVLQVDDASLIARIRALGFDGDTARVFDLLPLVHVAWADGKIQRAERASILRVLTMRGIAQKDEAWIFVEALLEQQPSDEYMQLTLQLLRDVVAHGGKSADTIVELCGNVANAAGGLFGLREAMSDEEASTLAEVAEILGANVLNVQSILEG